MPEFRQPIQLRPEGLLGFLDVKRAGAPFKLGEDLLTTLDLVDWYLQTNSEILFDPVGGLQIVAGGVTSFGIFVVPQTERWAVLEYDARLQTGLGETITTQVACTLRNQVFALGPEIELIANQLGNARMTRDRPVILAPGDGLIVDTKTLAGAVDVVPAARICRLPI